jgi:hypothetical protein
MSYLRLCADPSATAYSEACVWNIFTDTPLRTHSIQFRLNQKVRISQTN